LKSNNENEKPELQREPIHGQFYRELERPNVEKENPWRGYVAQA